MSTEAEKKRIAEILRKANMTAAQAGAAPPKSASTGAIENGVESIVEAAKTINKTAKIGKEAWRSTWAWMKPVGQGVWKILGPIVRAYQKAWKKTDSRVYEGKFKKGLAKTGRGFLLAMTAGVGISMIPSSVGGDLVRAVTTEPVIDGLVVVKDSFRMTFSYNEKETLYLNRDAQTSIDQNEDSYKVKGVDQAGKPVYFVIKPGFLHSQWNLKHNDSIFYNTKNVASTIPSGDLTKCVTTNYGSRNPFVLYVMRSTPVLLEAKCDIAKTSFNDAVTSAPVVQVASAYQAAPAPAI